MFNLFARLALGILVLFIVPSLAAAGWWMTQHHEDNWRSADWSSSGVLPAKPEIGEASIYILAARTGGLKGALSLHSWLVLKRADQQATTVMMLSAGARRYARMPTMLTGDWYSNTPFIVHEIHGAEADALIPKIEAAIEAISLWKAR